MATTKLTMPACTVVAEAPATGGMIGGSLADGLDWSGTVTVCGVNENVLEIQGYRVSKERVRNTVAWNKDN